MKITLWGRFLSFLLAMTSAGKLERFILFLCLQKCNWTQAQRINPQLSPSSI